MGVALLALVTDGAHDVGLSAGLINGVAHGFTVNRQTLVDCAIVRIPVLKGLVEFHRVHPDQYIAQDAFAGHPIFSIAVAAAESGARLGA